MKKRYKILLIVLAAVVCGVAGGWYMLKPLMVEVEAVVQGPLAERITEQGTVAPEQGYTLNAPMSGTVEKLLCSVGEAIAEGEPLLKLDASRVEKELENQVASLKLQQSAIYSGNNTTQAELALRREQLNQQLTAARQEYERLFGKDGVADSLLSIAQLNYSQARRTYRDADDYFSELNDAYEDDDWDDDWDRDYTIGESNLSVLRNQMHVAQENLVIAQNNSSDTTKSYYEEIIASCEAQLQTLDKNDGYADNGAYAGAQQLQLTIDTLQEKLDRPPVTAPHDGIVWNLLVAEGDFISENQPIASLYAPSGMCVEAQMLAEDALSIQVGDVATCQFADGTVLDAQVTFISPVAQEVVSTIGLTESRCTVKLKAGVLPAAIGAGHQAKLRFTIPVAEDTLSVSAGSILPWESGSAVYAIRDNKAVLTPVEVGAQRDGRVQILAGLSQGDPIVGNPYDSKVSDGKRVTW